MLSEITIENVAVIEQASVQFGPGFNVLTGETGAGKSILIDSIHAILGSRASRELVRSGADKARIWAHFTDIDPIISARLEAHGYAAEGELLLAREISREGKSTCRINGAPATAAVLKDVCEGLVQIHGQHDNTSLLEAARHLAVLDMYAQNATLLGDYRAIYAKLRAAEEELAALQMDEGEKARKIDLLRYEIDEIDAAELQAGEEEALLERRNLARNARQVLDSLHTAWQALAGDDDESDGAATLLGLAAGQLAEVAPLDEALAAFSEQVHELYYNATELASDLQSAAADYDFEGNELDALESRLDLIYHLKQKYGPSVEAILEYGSRAAEELSRIELSDERRAALEAQLGDIRSKVDALAEKLTRTRKDAFKRLNKDIEDGLAFLNMPGISMELDWQRIAYGPDGADKLSFLISTNPGETPKPLAKVASGGELARIMLAIKNALAERDRLPTVIYDEVDTGISGLAAGRIGQMLRDTAKGGRQVICVTHTAQIAAFAQQHLYIEKEVSGGRTHTHIHALDDEQRAEELARIISGDAVNEISLANAKDMLRHAKTT